jgi:hypothetical protein
MKQTPQQKRNSARKIKVRQYFGLRKPAISERLCLHKPKNHDAIVSKFGFTKKEVLESMQIMLSSGVLQ